MLGVKGDEVGHVFDPFRANEAEFHHTLVGLVMLEMPSWQKVLARPVVSDMVVE